MPQFKTRKRTRPKSRHHKGGHIQSAQRAPGQQQVWIDFDKLPRDLPAESAW